MAMHRSSNVELGRVLQPEAVEEVSVFLRGCFVGLQADDLLAGAAPAKLPGSATTLASSVPSRVEASSWNKRLTSCDTEVNLSNGQHSSGNPTRTYSSVVPTLLERILAMAHDKLGVCRRIQQGHTAFAKPRPMSDAWAQPKGRASAYSRQLAVNAFIELV